MKVIGFISKISSLIPNVNKLLDDEPNEVKNEIKDKYSRMGWRYKQVIGSEESLIDCYRVGTGRTNFIKMTNM